MHKKVIQLTFFVFCSFFVAAQSYTEVNSYLKEKISLFYIGQPNSPNLTIHALPVDSIIRDRDGVLFGRGGNNRMSNSASFLLRLFKPWNSRGDSMLQKKVYELLRIKNKPLKIYFINDAMHELSPNPAVSILLYDTTSLNGRLSVYPTVITNQQMAEAGLLCLGEQYFRHNRAHLDEIFKALLVKSQINSNTPFHPLGVTDLTHSFPQLVSVLEVDYHGLSAGANLEFTDHSLALTIAFLGDSSERSQFFDWMKTPAIAFSNFGTVSNGLFATGAYRELLNHGFRFDETASRRVSDGRRFFINLSNVNSASPVVLQKYKIRNEFSQILFFEFCSRFCNGSFRKATQFISYGANRYGTTAADNKMAVLADNISKVLLGDNTPEQMISTYNDRGFLAPVLYVHFLAGAPENFTYNDFSTLAGQGYTEQLFNQYTPELRQRVIQLRRGITGHIDWKEALTSLYRILRS